MLVGHAIVGGKSHDKRSDRTSYLRLDEFSLFQYFLNL